MEIIMQNIQLLPFVISILALIVYLGRSALRKLLHVDVANLQVRTGFYNNVVVLIDKHTPSFIKNFYEKAYLSYSGIRFGSTIVVKLILFFVVVLIFILIRQTDMHVEYDNAVNNYYQVSLEYYEVDDVDFSQSMMDYNLANELEIIELLYENLDPSVFKSQQAVVNNYIRTYMKDFSFYYVIDAFTENNIYMRLLNIEKAKVIHYGAYIRLGILLTLIVDVGVVILDGFAKRLRKKELRDIKQQIALMKTHRGGTFKKMVTYLSTTTVHFRPLFDGIIKAMQDNERDVREYIMSLDYKGDLSLKYFYKDLLIAASDSMDKAVDRITKSYNSDKQEFKRNIYKMELLINTIGSMGSLVVVSMVVYYVISFFMAEIQFDALNVF